MNDDVIHSCIIVNVSCKYYSFNCHSSPFVTLLSGTFTFTVISFESWLQRTKVRFITPIFSTTLYSDWENLTVGPIIKTCNNTTIALFHQHIK